MLVSTSVSLASAPEIAAKRGRKRPSISLRTSPPYVPSATFGNSVSSSSRCSGVGDAEIVLEPLEHARRRLCCKLRDRSFPLRRDDANGSLTLSPASGFDNFKRPDSQRHEICGKRLRPGKPDCFHSVGFRPFRLDRQVHQSHLIPGNVQRELPRCFEPRFPF